MRACIKGAHWARSMYREHTENYFLYIVFGFCSLSPSLSLSVIFVLPNRHTSEPCTICLLHTLPHTYSLTCALHVRRQALASIRKRWWRIEGIIQDNEAGPSVFWTGRTSASEKVLKVDRWIRAGIPILGLNIWPQNWETRYIANETTKLLLLFY